MRPLSKGTTVNQKTALALVITASAAAGVLITSAIDDIRIINLKNQLAQAKFKNKLLKHAADAMREEIPSDRVRVVIDKIQTDYEFESIAARNS